MKKFLCVMFVLHHIIVPSQIQFYYKSYPVNIGLSALSATTLTAKTFSFNYGVYKLLPDTTSKQLFVSIRQKDANGKNYTNKGYHLSIRENDSACCVLEDNKFDLLVVKDYLLLSNEKKSSRFNPKFGFEQFEFPSRIIQTILKNNTGLTYNSAFKVAGETALSAVDLNDGNLKWSAPITSKSNWNETFYLNDSTLVVAAGGLHAVDINKGLLWSHKLTTSKLENKALVYSPFNQVTWDKISKTIVTNGTEPLVMDIASNILVLDSLILFAGSEKLLAVDKNGALRWEANLSGGGLKCRSLLYKDMLKIARLKAIF